MRDKEKADSSRPDYRVFETRRFSGDLDRIPHNYRERIGKKLRLFVYPQLRSQPHFGSNIKKLKNWAPDTWRYRIGSWRFFYEISEGEKIVFMTAAEHRSEIYREK